MYRLSRLQPKAANFGQKKLKKDSQMFLPVTFYFLIDNSNSIDFLSKIKYLNLFPVTPKVNGDFENQRLEITSNV